VPQRPAAQSWTETTAPRLDIVHGATVVLRSPDRNASATSRSKRIFDICTSIACLVVAVPIIGVAGALVRLTSPGPALFRQQRVGLNGELFTIYKLRTMSVDNDDSEHRAHAIRLITDPTVCATDNGTFKLSDPRVTTVGKFLRAVSIDELPQLVNVLKGDMSLVGPRPMLPFEHEHVATEHRERVAARPGMTGLWQVSGRSELSTVAMLDLDIDYVDNWSMWNDIKILLRTPFSLLSR
jgi:lipopolysaccharide/colanic/teichoic acid biosynthesis glycosyltransferase